jgi:enterochelin esterase-like enzyme
VVGERLVARERIGRDRREVQNGRRKETGGDRRARRCDPRDQREGEGCGGAGGDPRERHAAEGLLVLGGELLEREGAGLMRTDVKGMKLRQRVEPAEASQNGHNGHDPGQRRPEGAHRKPSRRFSWQWLALVLACAAWLAVGVQGAFQYGHAYWVYRGFEPPKDPPGISPGRLIVQHFYSQSLKQVRSFKVYLPPGYVADSAAGKRFPVVYVLHGSPGGPAQITDVGAAGVKLDQLVATHRIRPFLLVMPSGGNGTFFHDTEWSDTPSGHYESFVLDVVRTVDARFPTVPQRRFRAIAGLSEGAYGALNIGLHHLGVFGVISPWSGYFIQKPGGPFKHASPATIWANSPGRYLPLLRPALQKLRLHVFMYSGAAEKIVPHARLFAQQLHAAGADVTFRVYPGHHDWKLWRGHMDAVLKFMNQAFWPTAHTAHPGTRLEKLTSL